MNLIQVMVCFPTKEACITYLESVKWSKTPPYCPHWGSTRVAKRTETEQGRIGRWNCHACHASFKVACGTVFHGTKIALQQWFLAISLVANAKKNLSSHQLARDLGLNPKMAWYLMTRIRAGMAKKGRALLQGILEVDETYIRGKPRQPNQRADAEPANAGVARKKPLCSGLCSAVVRFSPNWCRT